MKKLFLSALLAMGGMVWADVDLRNAVIVHPDTLKGRETVAVSDLKTALEKMTGKKYTAVPESKAPKKGTKIYVGNTRAAAAAGINAKQMEPQQFKMKAGNGKVFLVGGTPTGTSFAVSTFLQTKFGVYCFSGDSRVYPKNTAPVVKDFEKCQKPDVMDRTIYSHLDRGFKPRTQKKWHDFHRINRMTWANEDRITPGALRSKIIRRTHTFYQLVPPEKYFKDHPEYFSMRTNGQRDWRFRGNLCLTNKEVWQVALKELRAAIRKERRKAVNPPTLYAVASEDNPNSLCECGPCKKREKADGTLLPLMAEFVNFIAREIRKDYPDVKIATNANRSNSNPNVKFQFEKNVRFIHADRTALSNSLYPLSDPMNKAGYDALLAWQKKVPELGLWDYFWCPGNTQPMIAVDAIIADCRLFRDIKLTWLFKESELQPGRSTFLSFHQLQIFLELQLLFDASQNPEKLIKDFMNGYYGAAAPEMMQYFTLLRNAQNTTKTSLKEWNQRENRKFAHVTEDFLLKGYKLVKKGLAKVKQDKVLSAHVSWELLTLTASLFSYTRNVPGREAEYKQYRKDYKEAVLLVMKVWDFKEKTEKRVMDNLAQDFAEDVKFNDLPPELAKLPSSAYIPVQSKYLKGHAPAGTQITSDPESSQPRVLVKRVIGSKAKKFLPVVAGVACPGGSKQRASIKIKKAPADEKYHWYRLGVATLNDRAYIHVSWSAKLLLKDFYNKTNAGGKNLNRYEIWVSIKMTGPAYVPGSQKENGLFIDRGLLVKKY